MLYFGREETNVFNKSKLFWGREKQKRENCSHCALRTKKERRSIDMFTSLTILVLVVAATVCAETPQIGNGFPRHVRQLFG